VHDPLDNLPALRDVIAAHNLRAHKSLGQNFLLDANVTDKIARLAGDLTQSNVFEIGPGPGGLTRSLLRAGAAHVTAIEFDPRAVAALKDLEIAASGRLNIIHADALNSDLCTLRPEPRAIVANLPYNIATTLLAGWLQQIRNNPHSFSSMTLMFQKEVAQRLCAAPRSKAYGRLSVMTQWLCTPRIVYDLPASAFTPPPKVASCVVGFTPRSLPLESPSWDTMTQLTMQAFGQRRKMLRSTLKSYVSVLEEMQIDPTLRAEDLTPETYVALALRVITPNRS
jgi:16S rRNA (adenine1518-N6/adenine1519-N6)-dimethyltransferase